MFARWPQDFYRHPALRTKRSAAEFIRDLRWQQGAFCPLCRSSRLIHHFADQRTHKCGDCRARFSIQVGTFFEGSKLSLQQWLCAIALLSMYRGRITSVRLAWLIKVRQKTAWSMIQRLRATGLEFGPTLEATVRRLLNHGGKS